MTDPEQVSDAPDVSFPRGGRGPAVPPPKGASVLLLIVSVGLVGGVLAMMAWLFL